jgi:hypothetical protein
MREKSDIAAGRRETEVLETSVKAFSRSAVVLLALAVAGTPARSRSLHITGTAGYLSEWEFDGKAAEARTGGELVGPLVWKHIGLCSVNGPEEKPGKIRIRRTRPKSMRRFSLVAPDAPIAGTLRAARTG